MLLYYLALKISLRLFPVQVMSLSWCSVWTTGSPFRRCSAWSGRSTRPNPAWETKPRRTRTSRWSSAATSATGTFIGRCKRTRSSSLSAETNNARTLRSRQRRTPTWTRCFRLCSPWPSYPTKWVPIGTAKFPCSTASCSTANRSEVRNAKTGTRTVWWRRLRGDPACTVTWCT